MIKKLPIFLFCALILVSVVLPKKTEFQALAGTEIQASISVYANRIISEINQDIYGNNVSWFNHGIWGWNSEGFNLAVLGKIKEISPSIIRYPGGGSAHYFHWKDSIGSSQNRPSGTDGQGHSFQMKFGVDEFMLFAKEIGADPLITVNTLNGTAEEAAAWVAYMNGRKGNMNAIGVDLKGVDWKNVDFWAREREKNGRPEPYDVKYWEIGNEDYFFWTSSAYYAVFENFARKMKTIDQSIKTGAVAQRKWWRNNAWEPWLGPANKENFDFAAYHDYRGGFPFKYEALYSSGKRIFVSIGTNSGTFKFKLNLGGSGNNWSCVFSDNTNPLLDAQNNRIEFSTPPPGTEWNSWEFYSKEFILSQGSHSFSIECTAGLKTLYLRDVILVQKDSTGKFQPVGELSYSSIEDASKSLWAESKKLSSFVAEYRSELNSPKTQVFFTEFNSEGFDRELVDLRNAIFISDLLIQMIKSRLNSAQYWLLTDYPNRWTNLIDYANPGITRPNFLVLKLFSSKVKGQLLEMQLNTPAYIFGGSNVPLVEGIAGKNPEGNVFLALVNKSVSDYANINIQLNEFEPAATVKAFILNGPALGSDNEEQNNVTVKEVGILIGGNGFNYTLEPHSLTIIEILAKTVPAADATPPTVSSVFASNITANSATISWTTNKPTTSKVKYGLTATYNLASPLDTNPVTLHTINLSNLTANTTYHFQVISTDSSDKQAFSADQTLTTKSPIATDTTPPLIRITFPTQNPVYTTDSSTVSLSGSASDNVAITKVSWSNNKGGLGTALGTADWLIDNIELQSGQNLITVTAEDSAGNKTTDVLTVTYNLPSQLTYGDGSLLKASDDDKIYVISNSQRCWIPDPATFQTKGYDWSKVIQVNSSVLEQYVQGPNVSVAASPPAVSATLLKAQTETKVYQIVSGKRLWIPTAESFNSLKLSWNNISIISVSQIQQYPRLALAKTFSSPKVYYLTESGQKRHIPSPEVFVSYGNRWEDIVELNQAYLDAYPENNLIRLEGGSKVYLLQNGTKRWIKTAEAFNQHGYDWTKIAPVNQTELDSYQEGGEISL